MGSSLLIQRQMSVGLDSYTGGRWDQELRKRRWGSVLSSCGWCMERMRRRFVIFLLWFELRPPGPSWPRVHWWIFCIKQNLSSPPASPSSFQFSIFASLTWWVRGSIKARKLQLRDGNEMTGFIPNSLEIKSFLRRLSPYSQKRIFF